MNSPRLALYGQMEMAPLRMRAVAPFQFGELHSRDPKSCATLGSCLCGSMTYLFATPASKDL
jgi:hypothetical protein